MRTTCWHIFVKNHEAGAKGIAVRYNKFDVENSYPSSRFSCSMLRILELSQYICLNVHNMFAYIRTIPAHMIECVKKVCTCNATRGWRQSGSQYSTIIFILKAIIPEALPQGLFILNGHSRTLKDTQYTQGLSLGAPSDHRGRHTA